MTEKYSIGLDLGGTNLRAAAIDREGTLLHMVTGHTQYSEGREAIMSDIVDAISTVREKQGAAGLAGIGVVVPGFISLEEGVVRNCNNIPPARFRNSRPAYASDLQQRPSSLRMMQTPPRSANNGWARVAV